MTTQSNHLRVTLVQINASRDIQANLGRLKQLLTGVGTTDLIALPEVFAIRGSDRDYQDSAQPLTGPLMNLLASVAHRHNAWVLAGSIVETSESAVYNTSVLLNRRGEIAATYRKIHLFEAELDSGEVIRESDLWTAGSTPVIADVDGWQCGMAICYDLRFPELYRLQAVEGAELLMVPACFTRKTTEAHWQTLMRARAIENHCFVVAANQVGEIAPGMDCGGDSMILDPWGTELAKADTKSEMMIAADLDFSELKRIRSELPSLASRQPHTYGSVQKGGS